MQADVVGADVEQLRHLHLGQPDGLAFGAQLDATAAVLAGVEDQAAHEGNALLLGKIKTIFQPNRLKLRSFSLSSLCISLISLFIRLHQSPAGSSIRAGVDDDPTSAQPGQ